MVIGVLIFGVAAFGLSWWLGKRGKTVDGSELSCSVLVITWGAMLYGMFIAGR